MDGAHTHGGGGGDFFGPIALVGLVVVGAVVVGPIILAIIHALVTLLIIALGVSAAGFIVYLSFKVKYGRSSHPLPWQEHTRQEIPQMPARAITASNPRMGGHLILTDEEYEAIRQHRYG